MAADGVADILSLRAAQTEAALAALCDDLTRAAPARLVEAIRYSLLAGGKRLRPTLVLEWADAIADCRLQIAESNAIANPKSEIRNPKSPSDAALACAAAVELIHTFSLVHDDLPAMDDDDLRRGRPTNHKVFGEAMAILAGDAMTTLAFELLATRVPDSKLVPTLVRELAGAAGPVGMIGGQVLDMDSENVRLPVEKLRELHAMKTGALLTASCRLGAVSAGADDALLDAATRFGRHMGLAFQIMDDVLDVTSTPDQLGKATNKDEGAGKNTYPQLLGLDASRALAREQLDAALAALEPLGPHGDRLAALARFVVERDR